MSAVHLTITPPVFIKHPLHAGGRAFRTHWWVRTVRELSHPLRTSLRAVRSRRGPHEVPACKPDPTRPSHPDLAGHAGTAHPGLELGGGLGSQPRPRRPPPGLSITGRCAFWVTLPCPAALPGCPQQAGGNGRNEPRGGICGQEASLEPGTWVSVSAELGS